jgi:hypothetical protein
VGGVGLGALDRASVALRFCATSPNSAVWPCMKIVIERQAKGQVRKVSQIAATSGNEETLGFAASEFILRQKCIWAYMCCQRRRIPAQS